MDRNKESILTFNNGRKSDTTLPGLHSQNYYY